MTTRPRRRHDGTPEPADVPRRTSGLVPPGGDTTAAASQAGQDPRNGRLAYSVDEAARLAAGSQHLWEVSWLPGRALDRNSAITAMTLADLTSERDLNERHQLWPFIQGWAAELGLTGSDAINRAARPASPRHQHDRESERPDPEAGQ